MRKLFAVVLLAGMATGSGVANAGVFFPRLFECGAGCHSTPGGGCVVDGWGMGTRVRNECPVGARPRPPCGPGYYWRPNLKACFAS